MKRLLCALILACMTTPALAQAPLASCVSIDPPRDQQHPAENRQLLIPSHGVGMNALLFAAAGPAPKPTVILMHGLPGNERNLDLAQAIRRCGWNVLTFTYRGAWGSPGDFSIANAIEDTAAALAFARSAEGAKLGIDPRHVVLAGHSMGGATAALTAASSEGLDGLILLDAWDIAASSRSGSRAQLISGMNDFGNSLHGATPDSVSDEVIARGAQWDLVKAAPNLRGIPVLNVGATYGNAAEVGTITAALRSSGNSRVTAVDIASDHGFADHRIALASRVVGWLLALR